MNTLEEWQRRWNVPEDAMRELAQMDAVTPEPDLVPMSEAYVQSKVRLAAANRGWHLYRNNVGAGRLDNGAFIRWGLCNDSAALNERIKSADLIGWRTVLIDASMVGQFVGQFVSVECKATDWVYRGTPRENAQAAWRTLVSKGGGLAMIVNDPKALG